LALARHEQNPKHLEDYDDEEDIEMGSYWAGRIAGGKDKT
jgi:hypothetical protein